MNKFIIIFCQMRAILNTNLFTINMKNRTKDQIYLSYIIIMYSAIIIFLCLTYSGLYCAHTKQTKIQNIYYPILFPRLVFIPIATPHKNPSTHTFKKTTTINRLPLSSICRIRLLNIENT